MPLSAFVTIKEIAGPDFTNRFNLFRAIELTGGPAPGYTSVQALAALEAGFAPCAGVAVGLDRLLMVILNLDSIDQVLTFKDWD